MSRVSQSLDRVRVTFDDDNLVANAGLLLPATLVEQLGVESLINTTVRLDGRVGGASPGRKVLTLMNTRRSVVTMTRPLKRRKFAMPRIE